MSEPLLSVENLTVTFDTEEGTLTAVDDISFRVERGEILGVVGESGCGKSVTAMSILRLIPKPAGKIAKGSIAFEGTDLTTLSLPEMCKRRGSEISMIFQEPMTALSPLHRVGRQLVEAQLLHREISKEEAWANSIEWLDKVGAASEQENLMLDLNPDREPNSRLSCQIEITDDLDGLVVNLPEFQY